MNHKLKSRLPGEMSTIWYANDTILMVESEEELKSFLRVKEESEKADLKLNIKNTKIMASSPITSWQIDGENVESVRFYFLGFQNHGGQWVQSQNCSSGREATMNLDGALKSRDVTLLTNVCIVKAMVFPVIMYGCESWTIQKVECRRIDAFKLWCWRRLLRVPYIARRSN